MSNFITYRIAATLQILVFFFISVFAFHPSDYPHPEGEEWPEFFYMPVIMLMLITLLNDGTLITIAYDNAKASETPNRWNLPALFLASSVLGFVSCVSSLILLHFLLDSWSENSFFSKIGLNSVEYGQVITAIYLKISVSDFLTLFSARTGTHFFWQVRPALVLFIGGCFALGLSSVLSLFWPTSVIEEIPVQGLSSDVGVFVFVWLFSLVFFFFQDFLKVATYRWMFRLNLFGVSSTGVVVLPDSTKNLIQSLESAMAEEGLKKT
jgi:H+-transporting ATPase